MSKLEDIFIAKRAIEDIKKICSHYDHCCDCPLYETQVCSGYAPKMWDTRPMFEEKR